MQTKAAQFAFLASIFVHEKPPTDKGFIGTIDFFSTRRWL